MKTHNLMVTALALFIVAASPSVVVADSGSFYSKLKGIFKKDPTPEEVVSGYFDAKKAGDFEKAYELLSSVDRAFQKKSDFVASERKNFEAFGGIASKMTFKLKSIDIQGKQATATIENTHPDLRQLFGAIFALALKSGKNSDENAAEKLIAEKLESGDYPTTTTILKKNLVQEADGWRIYEGFQITSRAKQLIDEAEKLDKEKKYGEAIKKYDEVLALNSEIVKSEHAAARKKREASISNQEAVIEKARSVRAKNAYIGNVQLYGLTARYYETYLDKRVPGVEFKIKNNGDKTLKLVKVTVYFKDAKGGAIYEKDFRPVNTEAWSTSGDNKPLKSGYVWQLERGKFFVVKSVPTEWKEGAVEARITDIEFAK